MFAYTTVPIGAERLLVAAQRLFATRGFPGTSIREIVRAAHVSRPVLYYHFGSREGLLRAQPAARRPDCEAALWSAACSTDSIPERIRRVCRGAWRRSRRDWVLLLVDRAYDAWGRGRSRGRVRMLVCD